LHRVRRAAPGETRSRCSSGGKHPLEEHTTGKVTGNSDGVRAEAGAEKGAAIGVGGGYRSRNICMEISCGGERCRLYFFPHPETLIRPSRLRYARQEIVLMDKKKTMDKN